MFEHFLVSEDIKKRLSKESLIDNSNIMNVLEIKCKNKIIYVSFKFDDTINIKKKYKIKHIYINDRLYSFNQYVEFKFIQLTIQKDNQVLETCIESEIFWSNIKNEQK